jgi:hypothetical protein
MRSAPKTVVEDAETTGNETEVRIEGQARALARAISGAPPGQRERLRDMAVHVLGNEVEIGVPPGAPIAKPTGQFNPFGIGVLLLMAGIVVFFLFPAVGALLFAAAGGMMVWGLAAPVLARR